MRRIVLLLAFSAYMTVHAATWYVRVDGGGIYDAARVAAGFTGAAIGCNGKTDAPYPGSGTNQNCAVNDYRLLYDDETYQNYAWIIAGGDTVIIRGCAHNSNQPQDYSPACRIGWDNNTGPGAGGVQCFGGSANQCPNPPIPAGTSGAHTRILGGNYASCNTGGATDPQQYASQLTTLFGGFGNPNTLNLAGTQYVDVQCLHLTTHNQAVKGTNGICIIHRNFGPFCVSSVGSTLSDYDSDGVTTDNTTAHVTMTDVLIDGHTTSGIHGPIGGAITMLRDNVSYNGFAGWNFDDGGDTPDAAGSSIDANYVTMTYNGCNQESPIVDAIPAQLCYDLTSGGFGDSWSGQDTELDSFTCNHCVMVNNTKDGFIGPHTNILHLLIENSVSAGNMGQQWKWVTLPNSDTTFINNLTIGNCNRMSAAITGAPSGFNAGLSLFCRASGDVFSFSSNATSTVLFANDTQVMYSNTVFDIHCNTSNACSATTFDFRNQNNLGYTQPSGSFPGSTGQAPGLYFYTSNDPTIAITTENNVEFGVRNGNCDQGGGTAIVCADPLLVNEPAQGSIPPESTLDELLSGNYSGFYLQGTSPALLAGTTGGPSVFFDGTTQTSPATIGAMPSVSAPAGGKVTAGSVISRGSVTTP